MTKLQQYDESNMQLKEDSAVRHDLVRAITLHNETIRFVPTSFTHSYIHQRHCKIYFIFS